MKEELLSLKAPAKINWFLYVFNKRKDGYHNIYSLMQCVSLYDILRFEHNESVEIITNTDIPYKENLIYKAVILLKRYLSTEKGVKITLEKNIPISAGLGGGSSDAAYTIIGLNKLWELNLNKKELIKIAQEIGSDVPFFLNGKIALVEGKGDKIKRLNFDKEFLLLLIKPDIKISTSWAYSQYDDLKKGSRLTKINIDIKLFFQALEKEDFKFLNDLIYNEFNKIVFREFPILRKLKNKMIEEGALLTGMSGSGPTLFGIYKKEDDAMKALKNIKPFWGCVVKTLI